MNELDKQLIKQLRDIHASSCYNELVALSQKSSLLTRIDKDSSETILSKFIKNVLDDMALNNSLPIAPMGYLLRYVVSRIMEEGCPLSSLNMILLTNPNIDVETSYINTEEPVNTSSNSKNSKKDRRIDIFARGRIKYEDANHVLKEEPFCLVIENKIKSKQHDDQCQFYYDYIERKYPDIPHKFYIYLDPKEEKSECGAYINISYNELMHHVLDPLLSEIKHLGGKIPDDYYRDLIELIDTLQHPAEFMSDQPIALSKDYRDLLSNFYKENRELILLAAKECADDEDFTTIEKGFKQRRSSVKYVISHPNLQDVEANEKNLLEKLLCQYDVLGKDFTYIEDKFRSIGKFYVYPNDNTTGYGDKVKIGGKVCKISTQKGRKDKGKFDEIKKIAEGEGFEIR
ncbi:MAG: PD-(D/E)XK nuclease family protein [Muribaculaceae bacterium]|nr:PD-(D/E)XK nuclease family protein [Muribaculaceae bacterium]